MAKARATVCGKVSLAMATEVPIAVRQTARAKGLVYLLVLGVLVMYNMFANWAEFGENIKYILFHLPLAIVLIRFAHLALRDVHTKLQGALAVMSLLMGAFLLIPPFIIYSYLIK